MDRDRDLFRENPQDVVIEEGKEWTAGYEGDEDCGNCEHVFKQHSDDLDCMVEGCECGEFEEA